MIFPCDLTFILPHYKYLRLRRSFFSWKHHSLHLIYGNCIQTLSSYNDMLNRASLKHNNVFKQPCYRALLLERIVYVFPLSLLLQPETFGFLVTEFFTTKCRKTRCNRKPCNRTQINLDIGYRFSSALLICYGKIINISLKVMINDWLSPTNIIVYRTLFIGSRSFRRMSLKLLFKF